MLSILIIPTLVGFIFTFLIFNFDFFDSKVSTIKKEAEDISPGIS